jgi:hypothetical protein
MKSEKTSEPLVVNELHEVVSEMSDEQMSEFADWVKTKMAEKEAAQKKTKE